MKSTNSSNPKEFILSFIKHLLLFKSLEILSLLFLSFSLLLLSFNKVIFLDYPSFFPGKFNYFHTSSLLISEIPLLISSIFFLSLKLIFQKIDKVKFQEINYFFLIFLGAITLINPNLHSFLAILLYLSFHFSSKNEKKTLVFFFSVTLIFQSLISLYQSLSQNSLGLHFLGEPSLNKSTKGISKLYLNGKEFLRAYGTFPHPNVLAAFLAILINYLDQSKRFKKTKTLLYLGLLGSFSLSNSISLSIINIYKKLKLKKVLNYTLVLSLFVAGIIIITRLQNDNYENLSQRYQEIQEHNPIQNEAKNLKKQPWEITPTHNIYLYTQENYGYLSLIILIIALGWQFKKNPSSSLFLIIIFFSDHFWLSLPQGILLLSIAFSLLSTKVTKENNPDFLEENQPPTLETLTQAESF